MKKLLIAALALITVLTMSLAACSDNNTQTPDNGDLTDDWVDNTTTDDTTNDTNNEDNNGGDSTDTPSTDTQTWVDKNDTVYVLADGVRLRSTTSTAGSSNIKAVVNMKTQLSRTKTSNDGWSEVTHNGETLYIKSAYLTTNFNDVDFVTCEEKTIVLDSDIYNIYLRSAPTTAEGTNAADAVATEFNAKAIKYSEINKSGTWARIQYEGKTLYIACSLFDGVADNAQGGLG